MSWPEISKEQFMQEYAERSKTTVEELLKLGRVCSPCDCHEGGCQGWQFAYQYPENFDV